MKELDFINVIVKQTQSEYIGDDCAYLKDLNIVITQDNFVEDIHFKRAWSSPYQIGYKAAAVNISDILASGAKPAYLSVGLSASDLDEDFIKEFYKGVKAASYGAKVIGGDITGGDKIFVSITAIGETLGRNISSRKFAKPNYVVVASSEHGDSARGFNQLVSGGSDERLIKAHLEPVLDVEFSSRLASGLKDEYAMMDTSDGLADALFKIAESSNVSISVKDVKGIFGFEDYKLVAAIPAEALSLLDNYLYLGKVSSFNGTRLEIDDMAYNSYDELNLYNHF